MQEMQTLLETQQTFVNDIGMSIENATRDLENGGVSLTKATEASRNSRKKKWIIFGCVMVLIAILVVVLYF